MKNVITVFCALVAFAVVAAGAAYCIYNYLNKKDRNYIECECEPDCT